MLALLRIALVITPLVFVQAGFGFDQFALPKEALASALVITAMALWIAHRFHFERLDALLGAFVLASAASAFVATNDGLAVRALGLTMLAFAAFVTARAVARDGRGAALLAAGAIGVTCVALTVYLEAQGVIDLALPGRAPAGTSGNRNYAAHLIVLGLPLVVALVLTATTRARRVAWTCALALLVAVDVLSRSRGAWIATAVLLIAGVALFIVRRDWRRARPVVLACAAGLVLGIAVPTRMGWNTSHPFGNTVARILDWKTGTGRGRLIEYRHTLTMVRDHWLVGVGTGNWSILYPAYASTPDPSYAPAAVQPVPRMVTSDWIDILAERGIIGVAVLAIAFASIGIAAWRRFRRAEPDAWMGLVGVLALAAALVMGTFDVVILRAEPALLLFVTLGVAIPATGRRSVPRVARAFAVVAIALIALAVTARGARQLVAQHMAAGTPSLEQLEAAARIDPTEYRIQAMLAQHELEAQGCTKALAPALRTLELFPYHQTARAIVTHCNSSLGTSH